MPRKWGGTCSSPSPDTVASMSCIPITEALAGLLATLAEQDTLVDVLDPGAVKLADQFGWVYRWEGRLGLTGAGSYHAKRKREVGLLG